MNACFPCANKVGLIPMPPVTRPPKACSCGGRKFMRAIPREHSGSAGYPTSARMVLTHPIHRQSGIFWNTAERIDIEYGWGRLEVFTCYACGKVEWYCSDVEKVPIHPHLMTDVVDYDATGPYR